MLYLCRLCTTVYSQFVDAKSSAKSLIFQSRQKTNRLDNGKTSPCEGYKGQTNAAFVYNEWEEAWISKSKENGEEQVKKSKIDGKCAANCLIVMLWRALLANTPFQNVFSDNIVATRAFLSMLMMMGVQESYNKDLYFFDAVLQDRLKMPIVVQISEAILHVSPSQRPEISLRSELSFVW